MIFRLPTTIVYHEARQHASDPKVQLHLNVIRTIEKTHTPWNNQATRKLKNFGLISSKRPSPPRSCARHARNKRSQALEAQNTAVHAILRGSSSQGSSGEPPSMAL